MARHFGLKARPIEVKTEWTWRDTFRQEWHGLIDWLKIILRLRVR